MSIVRHLHWIALLACAPAPLLASPVVPLTGVGLRRQAELVNRGCAFVGTRLYCWGDNRKGELGIGTASVSSLAERVRRPDIPNGDFVAPTSLAVARHSCVADAGSVWCWGENEFGQPGVGDFGRHLSPTRLSGLPNDIEELGSGAFHSCARSATDGVWCWGSNSSGETGQPAGPARPAPEQVPRLPGPVDAIAIGASHSCALVGGNVSCWGRNSTGQLGDGRFADRSVPAVIATLPGGIRRIAAGVSHSCALDGDGDVWCWGGNGAGQVGVVSSNPEKREPLPLRVAGLPGPASDLALEWHRTCALVAGRRWCWGSGVSGLVSATPLETPGPTGAPADWLGGCYSGSSGLHCQGADERYPQGQADARPVPGFEADVAQLALGRNFGCALTVSGQVWCWGFNVFGQLGQGNQARYEGAVRVDLPHAQALADGIAPAWWAMAAPWISCCPSARASMAP